MRKSVLGYFIFASMVINIVLLVCYIFFFYKWFGFHSDSAVKVVLAREIRDTGQLFPREWYYVNRDLFVLFGHTFILPLLSFMPAGYLAHAVSGVVSSALLLTSLWLVTSLLDISLKRRILIVSVFASGISGLVAENLYGQTSYGSLLYNQFFLVFFTWKALTLQNRFSYLAGLMVLILLILGFTSNPQRAFVYCLFPLIVATWHLQLVLEPTSALQKRWYKPGFLAAIIGVGVAVGFKFHLQILAGVNNIPGAGNARWLSPEGMMTNLGYTLQGTLGIIGAVPSHDGLIYSLPGLFDAVKLCVGFLILFFVLKEMVRSLSPESAASRQYFAVFGLVLFLSAVFLQVTTTIPSMSSPMSSARYLIPGFLFCFILFLSMRYSSLGVANRLLFSFVLAVLCSSGILNYFYSTIESKLVWSRQIPTGVSQSDRLTEFLVSHDLKYGYASYWMAGANTVLSNEKVRIRQVQFIKGIPVPMRHLSSERWYSESGWEGPTFVLLHSSEAEAVTPESLKEHGLRFDKILEFEGYRIIVFPQSLAKQLVGWDSTYRAPARYKVSKRSLHLVGNIVPIDPKSEELELVADRGTSGYLHYGPFISIKPGRYKVDFDLDVSSSAETVALVDVVAGRGQIKLGEKKVTSKAGSHTLYIDVSMEYFDLEMRVWASGVSRVSLRSITIEKGWESFKSPYKIDLSSQTPRSVGEIKSDENGQRWISESSGKPGFLLFGPYINLEPGVYVFICDVTTSSLQGKHLTLDVTSNLGERVLATSDFINPNGEVKVEFSLITPTPNLEFRIRSSGFDRVSVGNIRVVRASI